MKHEEKAKLSKREQFAQLRSDFTTFLYNKEGDEPAVVMGRTALSWGKFSSFEIFRIIIHPRCRLRKYATPTATMQFNFLITHVLGTFFTLKIYKLGLEYGDSAWATAYILVL